MKTVVKLDYATFAFEQGSISIPKIEDALAQCDLHFAQISNASENSPFNSPAGARGELFLLRGGLADNLLCIVF